MSLGVKVRELRKNMGWTQQKLADKVGVPRPYISRLETGVRNPSANLLLRLAGALKVDVKELHQVASYVEMRNDCGRLLETILREAWEHSELLKTVEVPIKGKVPGPYPDPKEGTYGYLLIPGGLLTTTKGRVFARQVDNDCLVGDGIHPGDYIIVDPQAPFVDGQIYLVRLPKELAAGHVYVAEDKLRVTSSNGECQDLYIRKAEVLGQVVLSGRWRTH